MVSNKCFRVISRRSFFGRLKKCLKKTKKINNRGVSVIALRRGVNRVKEKEAVYKYQGKEGKKSNVGDWENA